MSESTASLRTRIVELAHECRRFGYRRIHDLLALEGQQVDCCRCSDQACRSARSEMLVKDDLHLQWHPNTRACLPQTHRRGEPYGLCPFPRRQHTEVNELRTKQLSRIFQRFLACFFALTVSFLLLRGSHRSSRGRPPSSRLYPHALVDFTAQFALLLIVIYGDAMLLKLRIAPRATMNT